MSTVSRFARRSRITALGIVVGVTSVLVPIVAPRAMAATLNVSYTLEACNLDHGATINTTTHICSDNGYTTGNLGKSWAELDKVPFRVTLDNNGNSTASGQFVVAGDYKNTAGTATGWDQIGVLTLNTALSDASCSAVTSGATQITPSGQGAGGADQTIYRLITASVPANATCVYDYWMRLALGAHNFSGSSLQGNLWNPSLTSAGVGEKRVSIPVNEIAPQVFRKSMTATTGSSVVWGITKTSDTTNVDFLNTCDTSASRSSGPIQITVSWTKTTTSSGETTIVTTYHLENPAHLTAIATVNDTIYEGTTTSGAQVGTVGPLTITLPPGQTVEQSATTTTSSTATHFNDDAFASYTVDGTPAGSLEATADAPLTVNPPSSGATAVVTDAETLTPNNVGVGFRVTAVSGASGTFSPAYVPGAAAPVVTSLNWTSATQSDSGSVTFTKQIVLTQSGPFETTASLADTATVTPDGQTATSQGPVSTAITVSASTSVTVSKTIDVVLGAGDGSESFTFELYKGGTPNAHLLADLVDTKTITFNSGDGGATAKTATFTGLDLNATYTVHEVPTSYGYGPAPDQEVTTSACSTTLNFANSHNPARAQVRKVTVPAGQEAGWTFTLTGPGVAAGGEALTTGTTGNCPTSSTSCDPAGYFRFDKLLEEGTYTITETLKTNWDNTGATGDFNGDGTRVTGNTTTHTCTFTVNYPADADGLFECTFTNTKRGHVTVTKTENGGAIPAGDAFTFELCSGTVSPATDPPCTSTSDNTKTVDSSTPGGALDFGFLPPGTYTLCELHVQPGWSTTWKLNSTTVTTTSDATSGNVCYTFSLAADGTAAFAIDNVPPPGGAQRTIGYWKNWTSCDGHGNQDPVLDQTLLAAANAGHPITVGTLVLNPNTLGAATACRYAVNVLNKTTIDGTTKKASDPLFNMAAQLLGAELNVQAGAGTCAASTSAINQAQALLLKYNWNGQTYHPALTQSDKTLANQLNGTLDRYNNGLLC